MALNVVRIINIIVLLSLFYSLMVHATNTPVPSPNQLETIQIRGYHDSAVKSLKDKRDSNAIIEAISAQDIGKFPDKNVAEALQRITGISLSRVQGEGERVGVRGTTPEQNVPF